MLKKLIFILLIGFSLATVSCGHNNQSKIQKEYSEFKTDSIKQCTQNVRIVKAAVESAFDRIPENNGFWKRDKVSCVYDNNLKLWVAKVNYHYDRNNTYYKSSVTFHVKYRAEQNGSKAKVFYSIKQVPE